jgi:hypothetical protein
MIPANQKKLLRVVAAAAALQAQDYVRPIKARQYQ